MNAAVVTALVSSVIGSGLVMYLLDAVRAWLRRRKEAPSGPELTRKDIDSNILTMSRVQEQLERRNAALVKELEQADRRHARERAEAEERETDLRSRIELLEAKLRVMLTELEELRTQFTANPDGP